MQGGYLICFLGGFRCFKHYYKGMSVNIWNTFFLVETAHNRFVELGKGIASHDHIHQKYCWELVPASGFDGSSYVYVVTKNLDS